MNNLSSEDVRFFWQNVKKTDPNACWLWVGSRQSRGYGDFRRRGKAILAHRLSWRLHYGPIPRGKYICHRCDNPLCVNPAHLFVGTQQDNMQDMVQKGRSTYGERNPNSKLLAEQVLAIRGLYASGGFTQDDLAARFAISPTQISFIVRGLNWGHLPLAN